MTEKAKEKSKKKRSISSFTILLIILIVLALVTVVMSLAGVEGVQGATVANVATAPVKGFTDALPVCLIVLILGGFLGIVTETGALDAGIAALVKKLKGNELILIPILMFIFSIGGTTYGMCEETVPFYLARTRSPFAGEPAGFPLTRRTKTASWPCGRSSSRHPRRHWTNPLQDGGFCSVRWRRCAIGLAINWVG